SVSLLDRIGKQNTVYIPFSKYTLQRRIDNHLFNDQSLVELPKLFYALDKGKKYNIFQLIYVLNPSIIEGIEDCGCYIFDEVNSSLFLLKKMNQKSRENLLSHIFPINRPNSIDIMFGFAIDLLSSLIANGNRGYRIAL